jgi:DNA-binding SARP family transcriptional activator
MESQPEPSPDQPLVRVFTFGALAVLARMPDGSENGNVHYEPLSTEKLNRRGTGLAFTLLKVLLSQPQRGATRDQLLEWLSPDHSSSQAIKRLDDAASILRCLLRPASGENLLEYRQNSYRLSPYPLIWVDADAFHWSMRQACRLARFGEDALPLWEQAYALASRGTFLADDLYSDYTEQRRTNLNGDYKQCVHELARLYRERGVVAEAERVLREHIARDARDEDALRPLMELLGEQERYQEALACYQRTKAALAEDGFKPDPRTRDIMEFLRTKEIRREKVSSPHKLMVSSGVGQAVTETPRPAPPDNVPPDILFPLLSQSITQGIIQAMRELENQLMDTSRRKFLQEIAGTIITGIISSKVLSFANIELPQTPESWEQLLAMVERPAIIHSDTFSHFSHLIEACWGLCNAGETGIAGQVLDSFLPAMIQLAPVQPEAAAIAAHGLRLQSILSAHQLQIGAMIPLCQQAVFFGRLANDPDALSAALNGLAVAFKYAGDNDASFTTYQEALAYSAQASPLLRSRVYAGAASMFARRGQSQEALFYMGLAYEHFPDQPADDPHFLSADNGIYMLAYYQGLMYLAMNQPNEADSAFESYKHHPSQGVIPERNRLEIVNHQGRAAIMANNLERYVACLEEGLVGAIKLGSKKRFDEAAAIYQHDLPSAWQRELAIRQVSEQFRLSTEEK